MKQNQNLKSRSIKTKLKRNDEVIVVAGKDKGHIGKILSIDRRKQMVYVEGVNIQKKHKKPTSQEQSGKIIQKEGPIHFSNIMAYNSETGKGERVSMITEADGEKRRLFASSKTSMDN